MLNKIKENVNGHSVALATALVLLFAVVGCGGKKSTTPAEEVAARTAPVPTNIEIAGVDNATAEVIVPKANVLPKAVTYEEAEAAYNERRYKEATELFAAYTELKPENPWGYYMLGLSAQKSGDTESAILALEKAAVLDSLHAKTWINLSRVQLDAGNPEVALDNLDRAIELGGESSTTLRAQGRAFHQLGMMEDAVAAYRQAIVFSPEDYWSMNNLALVLIEEGRFEEASPILARAIELKGDIPFFHNNLGMALENSEHFAAAIDAYSRATQLDASYTKAIENLDRVTLVERPVDEMPIDLEALADAFEVTISQWITAADSVFSAPVDDNVVGSEETVSDDIGEVVVEDNEKATTDNGTIRF